MKFRLIYYLILLVTIASCATTETVTEEEAERPVFEIDEEIAEAFFEEEMDEFDNFIYERRSHLSDQFAFMEHEMPDEFLHEVVREQQQVDEYAGFRVQILSTRNVAEADSLRDDFRAWANERIDGFEAEAYVQFRQPTYRVRAGDFRDRNKAIEFSRIVKDKYPEAWVVHDRIEPGRVPSDTTEIRLLDPNERRLRIRNLDVD